MASGRSTVDTYVSRRRMGRSERAALVAGALALALGAAAWLTDADLSAQANTADVMSFEDRFVPLSGGESFHSNRILQPLEPSALTAIEGKLRDARGVLAQQLTSSDWRSTLLGDARPATTATATDIPMPRSRPALADVQLASADPASMPVPAPRTEDRSMLQKLSDLLPNKITLASLTPNSGLFQKGPDLAALGYDNQTAVYDISAHAVYLPSGLRLEAHSGLGSLKDDPEHVDKRMVGATPPATYELKPREKLFHGVAALRMLPVDGSSTLGRAGLLVHSFMLGPDGDSNGCVSVRDYERFRKAYDDGEITRLVVVPSLSAGQTAQRTTSQS
jgi:Protein of unknown function (DUF2778)